MKKIVLFGDSLLKGITLDETRNRYVYNKDIDWNKIEEELNIKIDNQSKMGETILKGFESIKHYINNDHNIDTVLIEYGGNDCDYDWQQVGKVRSKLHEPKTPYPIFVKTLKEIIVYLRQKNIKPLLMTLPSIHAKNYYQWIINKFNHEDNIMYFLGDIETIYRHHELYNQAIINVAHELKVELIDVRTSFLAAKDYESLITKDGIHVTSKGVYKIIESVLNHFKAMHLIQ